MPRVGLSLWLLGCMVGFPAGTTKAQAQPSTAPVRDEPEPPGPPAPAPRTYVNARVGAASSNQNGRPELCVEGAPLAVLSFEACGTGAQVFHNDPEPEIAHFRAKARFMSLALARFWLQGFVGAGFAELQVGEDAPGFDFAPSSARRTATAGPELTLSARLVMPVGRGLEVLGDVSVAAAYMAHAPELVVPKSRFQPTVGMSVGLGF